MLGGQFNLELTPSAASKQHMMAAFHQWLAASLKRLLIALAPPTLHLNVYMLT